MIIFYWQPFQMLKHTFLNVGTDLSMPWKVWTTRDCTSIAHHINCQAFGSNHPSWWCQPLPNGKYQQGPSMVP